MKFDIAITNPPYDRNLHLKILEKVIPHCEETINISPIRWLQDPLAKYKKNSDYNKFKESIAEKIEDVRVLTQNETDTMFGIQFNASIGIIKCSKKAGFDLTSIVNNKFISIYDKAIKKASKMKIVAYKDSKKDTFVPVCLLAGHTAVEDGFVFGISFARDRYKYFVHNKCQCERFYGQTPQECKSYNLRTFDTVPVIEFETKEEAKTFMTLSRQIASHILSVAIRRMATYHQKDFHSQMTTQSRGTTSASVTTSRSLATSQTLKQNRAANGKKS